MKSLPIHYAPFIYRFLLSRMCNLVLTRALSPWLWPNFIFHRTKHGKIQAESLAVIHGLTNKVIAERKEMLKNSVPEESTDILGRKKKKVFLDVLLQSSEEGGLTDHEI